MSNTGWVDQNCWNGSISQCLFCFATYYQWVNQNSKPYFEREAWKISCFYPMVRRMLFCWLSIPGFLVVVWISWDFLKNDYLKNQDQIWTFNHPKLNTKKHDHLKHETRDKYQSWKAKLDRPQIQGIKKKKIGVRSVHHPPPHLPWKEIKNGSPSIVPQKTVS